MGKFFIGASLLGLSLLTACSNKPKLEACTFIDIEKPEAEITIGDVDIEGGEVEMVCGEKILDVPWGEFKKHFDLDPKDYLDNLEDFKEQVNCLRDEHAASRVISCNTTTNPSDYMSLKFTFDD